MINFLKTVINIITKKEVYGVIVTIAISYFLYKTISIVLEETINYGNNGYERKKRKTITRLFTNVIKYLIIILALLTILSIYGVNVAGMVAGLGITATIIGLALQDTFKDIISGISIITEGYFIVGDIVEYNGFTGEVIEFGLKSTKIKKASGEVLIVANRNIMEIKNISQEDQTIFIDIGVHYDSKLENVEDVINHDILPKINNISNVQKNSAQYLGVDELADSSIKYLISFNCQREKQWQAKRDANRIILTELNNHGITIPYPQLEVHYEK